METLNIQAIEQQQVLITLTLTGSDGAPVDLTKYAVYAASVGAVDPYCRRAARLEWAAAINNECSAFIVTAPGHDIARAPWKYQICIKNRQLGLEWAVVSGRVELTPRACGTDGISPAAYTVACEATPSGLVNVTLDATVGSISTTLEQVKASAAAAAAAAQNAHADLEDAETAATKASQAALAAAADARIASDKATAAEDAATAAPEACAPYVQQVQQSAAAALDASRTANTAAASAQASADAAAPAQGYATRAEQAQTAAVQAAETATTAATTATEQATAATAQAESARLAATTATTAADNTQAAATRAEDAATRAEAATPAADRAEAAAATATTAAVGVPGLVTRAETAATASETAQQAAESAQQSAETAATTATQQAEAASASATQADTDARACAVYYQRVSANATTATEAATTATEAATTATEAATTATEAANQLISDELQRDIDIAIAAYLAIKDNSSISGSYITDNSISTGIPRLRAHSYGDIANTKSDIVVSKATDIKFTINAGWLRILYAPLVNSMATGYNCNPMKNGATCYLHAPQCTKWVKLFYKGGKESKIIFSNETNFSHAVEIFDLFANFNGTVEWAPGTKFENVLNGDRAFDYGSYPNIDKQAFPPDTATFASLKSAKRLFMSNKIERLPSAMVLTSALLCDDMFTGCYQLEVDDIVRVCSTINDLQSLETPKTGKLGLPLKCKHNGTEVTNTQTHLNVNHPDFLVTLAARGWTVTFA